MGGAASKKWVKDPDSGQWTLDLGGREEAGCTDCGVSVDFLEWGAAFFVNDGSTDKYNGAYNLTTIRFPLTRKKSCFVFGHNSLDTKSITVSENASVGVNVGHKGGVPEASVNAGAAKGIVIMKYFHIFITFAEIFFQSR